VLTVASCLVDERWFWRDTTPHLSAGVATVDVLAPFGGG
jgi:hypothetical protein